MDILWSVVLSRVALLLYKAIMDPFKALWQTPASLPSTAKHLACKYFVLAKGYKFLFSSGFIGGCSGQ